MTSADLVESYWTAALAHLDVFGMMGLCLGFAAGIMPRRSSMLLASAACATCFSVHFLYLGALTGTAMCAVSMLQNLVSAQAIGPERRASFVAPVFAATSLVAAGLTLATWNGWPSACAGLGALLATTARLQADARVMRRLFLGASMAWAGHNLLVGSVFGLTCDVLTLSGLAIALLRSDRPEAHRIRQTTRPGWGRRRAGMTVS